MFILALFTIAKIGKQPECPLIAEWTITMFLKKEILPLPLKLEKIMLREISQTEQQILCTLI